MTAASWYGMTTIHTPLTLEQAAQRTGGRLPGFKPRGDDNAVDRNLNLTDGDLYLRLLLSAAPGVSVVGEDLGCVPDYVENVGDACHQCRRPRAKAVPVPS